MAGVGSRTTAAHSRRRRPHPPSAHPSIRPHGIRLPALAHTPPLQPIGQSFFNTYLCHQFPVLSHHTVFYLNGLIPSGGTSAYRIRRLLCSVLFAAYTTLCLSVAALCRVSSSLLCSALLFVSATTTASRCQLLFDCCRGLCCCCPVTDPRASRPLAPARPPARALASPVPDTAVVCLSVCLSVYLYVSAVCMFIFRVRVRASSPPRVLWRASSPPPPLPPLPPLRSSLRVTL